MKIIVAIPFMRYGRARSSRFVYKLGAGDVRKLETNTADLFCPEISRCPPHAGLPLGERLLLRRDFKV